MIKPKGRNQARLELSSELHLLISNQELKCLIPDKYRRIRKFWLWIPSEKRWPEIYSFGQGSLFYLPNDKKLWSPNWNHQVNDSDHFIVANLIWLWGTVKGTKDFVQQSTSLWVIPLTETSNEASFQEMSLEVSTLICSNKNNKKPNPTPQNLAKVWLSNQHDVFIFPFIPGEGHNPKEHHMMLFKGGRVKDLLGVKLHHIRGFKDSLGTLVQKRGKSNYGAKLPNWYKWNPSYGEDITP